MNDELAAEQIEKSCYENLGMNTGNENRGKQSEIKKYFKAIKYWWTNWGYKDNPNFVRIFVGYSPGSHERVAHMKQPLVSSFQNARRSQIINFRKFGDFESKFF